MKYNWSKVPSIPCFFNLLKKKISFDNEKLSSVFFDTLEDFFYYGTLLGYIKNDNYKNVLIRLSKIKRVGYLIKDLNDKKSISISNNLGILLDSNLSSDELRFFMLKEISRNASSISSKVTKSISKDYLISKDVYGEETNLEDIYLEMGFRFIEDGINLDMAESIYYASKKQSRPKRVNKSEKKVFGKSIKFLSNFNYHPAFQELTSIIGRGILKNSALLSDDAVLAKLGRISLYNNFSYNLFLSLKSLYGENVYSILGKLGVIYKKETDVYNQNLIKDDCLRITQVKRAYKDIINVASQEKAIGRAC